MRNPVLVAALRAALAPVPLRPSDELGLPVDGKEAYLTALLGALSWHGLPGVPAGATGSRAPRVLGRFSPGAGPLRLPEPAGPVRTLRVVEPGSHAAGGRRARARAALTTDEEG
jgi:anhydro-N-acetylmuramic acid kinase